MRWERTCMGAALVAAFIAVAGTPALARPDEHKKVDRVLHDRVGKGGTSRVIITLQPGADPSAEVKRLGGKLRRSLRSVNGRAIELPNAMIWKLAEHPGVRSIHYDRPTGGEASAAAAGVGGGVARGTLEFNGAGVGVAVIDSGISGWHDDLTYSGSSSAVQVVSGQRVAAFVDFVNGRSITYDDSGHGTHVAGLIAGNGYDSRGTHAGIAPAAHLVGLKVLDEQGRGVISDVIAALDWVIANRKAHNIRVVNLSVGAAVTESFYTDPLTLAARQAVDSGVVVVAAAGNLGRNPQGRTQYGGITAPGNAPWVLTVGAYSHEGTSTRADDVMAGYSSRGPTAMDFAAKPDLVAPGTGMVSLSDPASLMYYTQGSFLLSGSLATSYKPYLSLTGTSMAAPVVSGTVALMLQANPSLTPNMVKAIVQYTAERRAGYDGLTQGGGFLNTPGAVQLARFYGTARAGDRLEIPLTWSKQITWGNQRVAGGVLRPSTNAFAVGTLWGTALDKHGDRIVWGTLVRRDSDNIVWGTFDTPGADNIVWGTLFDAQGENIVWGTRLSADNVVWGTLGSEDNIVWGTDCGGADCDNIVWGTSAHGDNIVWGTAESAENIVWGTGGAVDNIVWSTGGARDNIVWGTSAEGDNVTWGTSGEGAMPLEELKEDVEDHDRTSRRDVLRRGTPSVHSTDGSVDGGPARMVTAPGRIVGGEF